MLMKRKRITEMTKHLQAAGYLRAGPMAHSPLHTEHLLKGWKEQGSVSAERTKWTLLHLDQCLAHINYSTEYEKLCMIDSTLILMLSFTIFFLALIVVIYIYLSNFCVYVN